MSWLFLNNFFSLALAEIRMLTLLIKYARSAIHVACDGFWTSSEVGCFCTSKLDIFSAAIWHAVGRRAARRKFSTLFVPPVLINF
jgi:hypothetical protein